VILIVEDIFEEIVITVTDEFSHCRTISTVETVMLVANSSSRALRLGS